MNQFLSQITFGNNNNNQLTNNSFNAANYLFVSTRLAQHYTSESKVAVMISQFVTHYPKKNYQIETEDMSKTYNKNFKYIMDSISFVGLYLLTNLLSSPQAIQDILYEIAMTFLSGWIILVHVQLFHIFPALVIIPLIVVILLILLFRYMLSCQSRNISEHPTKVIHVKTHGNDELRKESELGASLPLNTSTTKPNDDLQNAITSGRPEIDNNRPPSQPQPMQSNNNMVMRDFSEKV